MGSTVKVGIRTCGNKWVCSEKDGTGPLMSNRDKPDHWEHFMMTRVSKNEVTFQACNNNLYVSAEREGTRALVASAKEVTEWETF